MMSGRERGFSAPRFTMQVKDFNDGEANLYILEYIYIYTRNSTYNELNVVRWNSV